MSDKSMTGFKSFVEKIKKFFCSRAGEIVVTILTSLLALAFTALMYSAKLTEIPGYKTGRDKLSLWTADVFYTQTLRIRDMNMYLAVAFAVGGVLFLVALLFMLLKKKRTLFYFAATFNAGLNVVCVIIGITLKIMRTGAMILGIVGVLVDVILIAYLIVRRRTELVAKQAEDEDPQVLTKNQKRYKLVLLICECVAMAILATVLFIPVYAESGSGMSYILIKSVGANNYPVYVSIGFIAMIIALFVEMLFFISTISDYFGAKTFAIRARHFVLSTTVFTLIFFLLGYCLAFYYNLSGTAAATSQQADTVCYIPFVLSVANMIVFSVFSGKIPVAAGGHALPRKPLRIEPLLAVLVITIITFAALAVNIIEIHVKVPIAGIDRHVAFTGYELLTTYTKLDSGFQMLAFIEFAFLLMSGILFVLSLMSYLGKDKSYYKLVRVSAIANFFFVLLIGLFGIYFKIGQKINVESIESVLKFYGITLPDVYEYEVTSQTIYMLIASVVVIVYMILRRIFSLGVVQTEPMQGDMGGAALGAQTQGAHAVDVNGAPIAADFDACPAFTEIDGLQVKFKEALEKRRKHLFENLTLPNLIRFLVDYARESRLHLSYTPDDMATFVAGLGASRLTILQGMSGTGKTSLPKIFTEALMSNCEIVEVESSWRDKNELLGYYNEFSKCYTPKKFTQCLYRARLNSEVISLIVLDEMNLSRIEYYFSDFLSLMENVENRRAIKLLNVKLSRTENGRQINYDGLRDGHTIKIPTNIWFIGTANRDESTFEISDKVYDRAQTMNFNKRAPKVTSFSEPLEARFISYDMLLKLFDDAKANYKFDAESNKLIMGAEKLLAPYNISFGNRILGQMESFVKIYCACFGDQAAVENDAVEKILLSKVVRKLENKVIENKESLAKDFDKLGLTKCSAFVRQLNED